MPRGVKNSGMSLVQTPQHPYKFSGKWFAVEEEGRAYAYLNNLKRRAKRMGFGDSDEELKKFRQAEKLQQAEIQKAKELKQREKAERDRLRQEHGLHPKAHVTGLYAATTVREEGRKFLARANRARMSDAERLDLLRLMYRQHQRHKISSADLILRIGKILGEPQ